MNYEIYKIIHILGALTLFLSFGGITYFFLTKSEINLFNKRFLALQHGIGMFLILLGGFGMLARLGIHFPWPGYIWVKLGIWLIFGFYMLIIRKNPRISQAAWLVALLLAGVAIAMARLKPF